MIDFDGLALGPCMQAFGEPVSWQSSLLAQPVMITGIFDEAFYPIDPLGGDDGMAPVHVTSAYPVLGVQLSQMSVPPQQGDLVTVRQKIFRIREVRPDGRGGAQLELNSAGGEYDTLSR